MDWDALEDQDRALVRRVLAAPTEVRAALLVMLENAAGTEAGVAPSAMMAPAMTDREIAGATLVAVGELAVRLTGEPLQFNAPVAAGYIGLRVP